MATRPRLRSVRGCSVCRMRHTKCDEVKPTCGSCSRLGLACRWAGRLNTYTDQIVTVTPRLRQSVAGNQALEYFVHNTLPILQQCQSTIPWGQTLAHLMQTETAICDIMIALSDQHKRQHDATYQRAITSWRLTLTKKHDPPFLIVGCLLFIILESLRESPALIMHLRNAVYLVNTAHDQVAANMDTLAPWLGLLQNFCASTWLYHARPQNGYQLGDVRDIYIKHGLEVKDWQYELNSMIMEMAIVRRTADLTEVSMDEAREQAPSSFKQLGANVKGLLDRMSEAKQDTPVFNATLAGVVLLNQEMNCTADEQQQSIQRMVELLERSLSQIESTVGRPMFSVGLGFHILLDYWLIRIPQGGDLRRLHDIGVRCPPREGLWSHARSFELVEG